jgi:hypothetical protein
MSQWSLKSPSPITLVARSKAWTVFAGSNSGIVGSDPTQAWMSVCVYSVFVLVCVGSGLAMGWSPIQGVLPTVFGLRNWSETKRLTDVLCSKWEQQEKRVTIVRPSNILNFLYWVAYGTCGTFLFFVLVSFDALGLWPFPIQKLSETMNLRGSL